MLRTMATMAAAMAMLAGALPVEAKDRPDDRREHRHRDRDRHDTISTGEGLALGAIAVIGLAALFGRKQPPRALETVDADEPPRDPALDREAAVSACAAAVEGEARRTFAIAQVGDVRALGTKDDVLSLEGDVRLRTGWQQPGERRTFRCTVDSRAVQQVSIDGIAIPPAAVASLPKIASAR